MSKRTIIAGGIRGIVPDINTEDWFPFTLRDVVDVHFEFADGVGLTAVVGAMSCRFSTSFMRDLPSHKPW